MNPDEGDLDVFADLLYKSRENDVFQLLIIIEDGAPPDDETLLYIGVDLIAMGAKRLYDVTDPTLLTEAQFVTIVAFIRRAGFVVTVTPSAGESTGTADDASTVVSGAGGSFRVHVTFCRV